MPSFNLKQNNSSPSSEQEEGLPSICGKTNPPSKGCCSKVVGRFAPTPSGKLHLGNLFSFLVAYLYAKQNQGSMLLRIEDLDPARSKQCYIDAVFRDLDVLGFEWEGEPVYQSRRTDAYEAAYEKLQKQGLLYPCFCSRADLHSANAPHFGEEVVYAGTCRSLSNVQRRERAQHRNPATRIVVPDASVSFTDEFQGSQTFNLAECSGDFILRRSDGVYAYQLAVVVDDAMMGVTSVVRGCDLITSTPRQIYLQKCLDFPTLSYGHIPLLVNPGGKRLAKRDKSTDIDSLLHEQEVSPSLILGKLAYSSGIMNEDRPASVQELVEYADLSQLQGKKQIVVSECFGA